MAGKRELYYEKALDLFLDGKTLREISGLLPVSHTKLGEWCHDDDWVTQRAEMPGSTRAMQRKLRAVLQQKVRKLDIHNTNAGVADELYKFWKMIHDQEAAGEEVLKSYRIDIMVEFLQYCHKAQGLDVDAQHDLINGFLAETVEGA